MLRIFKNFRKQEVVLALFSVVFVVAQVWLELKLPDYMLEITSLITTQDSAMHDILIAGGKMLLCAFGSLARSIKAVMTELRKKGSKVGVFRPITLSPFPHKRLNELAEKCKSFVVVEMNMGQMAKDVKYAVDGKADIYQVNRPVGQWLSVEEIIQEMNNQLGEKVYANV